MAKITKPITVTQPRADTTPSLEQYVETIAHLLTDEKVCSVSDIADVANVSRPAASRAVRELAEKQLVTHKAYSYVDLTARGRTLAQKLSARHEALYDFFKDVLLFDEDAADEEACRLEHQLDDDMVGRLDRLRAFLCNDDATAAAWTRKLKRHLGGKKG